MAVNTTKPLMAYDTTDPSYWLNWRFFLSALCVFGISIFALYLIWKNEGKKGSDDEISEFREVPVGVLYKDELWKPCLKSIHPIWLLLYRFIAFSVLLTLIIGNTVADTPRIFYFYTQWTFTLTTIYFGLATAFSIYGFCHDRGGGCPLSASRNTDVEQRSNGVREKRGSEHTPISQNSSNSGEVDEREIAGFLGYLFQIIFQVAAGAVLLTDIVYWLILYAIFTPKNKKTLDFFTVCMHTVNVLILGDAVLNCMRFPFFRIAYYSLWTSMFVITQWIIHVFISIPWPYPFLDLSPPTAPIWYISVGLLQLPCFGFCALIIKLKHKWFSKLFPDSYQVLR